MLPSVENEPCQCPEPCACTGEKRPSKTTLALGILRTSFRDLLVPSTQQEPFCDAAAPAELDGISAQHCALQSKHSPKD